MESGRHCAPGGQLCQDCPLWAVLACGAFNTDVDLLFLTAAGMRGGGGRRDRKSRCEDVKCKGRSSSAPSRLDGFKKTEKSDT